MNIRVREVIVGSTPGSRAARITVGAVASSGWCTAVLDSTTPASRST